MHVWTSAVCAAVGALVVASTGAAPAVLVLKLEIVALNNLRHGGAKEEVLPVVVQLHHARQQLGASRRRLCRELARVHLLLGPCQTSEVRARYLDPDSSGHLVLAHTNKRPRGDPIQ